MDINIGDKFNRLTVVRRIKGKKYRCVCDCGKRVSALASKLFRNEKTSCGCLRIEKIRQYKTTHGQSHTYTYVSWQHMIHRCFYPTDISYPNYGGRGIVVCKYWKENFLHFLADMGERPLNTSIDRTDNDGNYSCGHCNDCIQNKWPLNARWATRKTQANNRRNNGKVRRNNKRV